MSARPATTAAGWRRASGWLLLAGLLAFACADLAVTRTAPGAELLRVARGFLAPVWLGDDGLAAAELGRALANTLAFAFQGVAFGAAGGFLLALFWHRRAVRAAAASVRAVHELFWGCC
ncbi:hypothetical protein ASALC70_03698 [Alcanivorax sp. ALC70]|nr:hypothetical protein ASALC70_03698 [Alcanivorax sp. ALC70]